GCAKEPRPSGGLLEDPVTTIPIQPVRLAVGPCIVIAQIGDQVEIEPAIPVIVREHGHAAGVAHPEAAPLRLLNERAIPAIDVEPVRRAEPADVQIEVAVIVDIGKGGALPPRAGFSRESGSFGDILEAPVPEIAKETTTFGFPHDKQVHAFITVDVTRRDSRSDGAVGEFLELLTPHARIIETIRRSDSRV